MPFFDYSGLDKKVFNATTDLPICLREKIYLATGKKVMYFHGMITEVIYIDARTQEITFRVVLNREQCFIYQLDTPHIPSKDDTSAVVYNHRLIPTALSECI